MKLEIFRLSKQFAILSLVITFGLDVSAQDETMRIFKNDVSEYRNDTLWTTADQPTLVLIPFEPLMYKSQIDRSIGMNDGTNYQQIVGNWRISLDNILFIETDAKYSVIRLIVDDEERKKDLYAMYSASSLDYRDLPKKEERKKKLNLSKLKSKDKTEPEKPAGTRVENGQVVSDPNTNDQFMARAVKDSTIFDYMYAKYGSILYVFINQFEIGPMPGLDYRAFESDEYQRQITVHYSVYTNNFEVHSGIATSYFSSTNNSQKDIILQSFPELAKQIALKIPTVLQAKSLDNTTE